MNDAEQGRREWDSLRRQVEAIFDAPEGLAPVPPEVMRRSWLRLWTRPSFDNYGCWVVWGPPTRDQPFKSVILRRIVWRADLDGDRGNPMLRLKRLGKPLEPTLEVTDGQIGPDDLAKWLDSLPIPKGPAVRLLEPRPIALDGERYALEIDAYLSCFRIEWFGVNRDWTPSDAAYSAIARWAKEFTRWLDSVLDKT